MVVVVVAVIFLRQIVEFLQPNVARLKSIKIAPKQQQTTGPIVPRLVQSHIMFQMARKQHSFLQSVVYFIHPCVCRVTSTWPKFGLKIALNRIITILRVCLGVAIPSCLIRWYEFPLS